MADRHTLAAIYIRGGVVGKEKKTATKWNKTPQGIKQSTKIEVICKWCLFDPAVPAREVRL